MLPSDWIAYLAEAEAEIKRRPETAPKKARATGRLLSTRQRRAETGTRNSVKAIYQETSQFNVAQVVDPAKTTFTTNLGGNCESAQAPHGKATQSRT